MAEVDKLTIQIVADAKDASAQLAAFTESLQALKNVAKGGANLTATIHQLEKIGTALDKVSLNSESLGKLAEMMRQTGGGVSGLAGVTTALGNTGKAARSAGVDYSSLSEKVKSASTQFANLSPNAQKAVLAASKVNTAISGLSGTKIAPTINQASAALYSFATSLKNSSYGANLNEKDIKELATAYSLLPQSIQKAIKAQSSYSNTIKRAAAFSGQLASSAKNATSAFGGLNLGFGAVIAKAGVFYLAARRISGAMGGWVKSSSDYIEATNLFSVSMGEFYDEAFAYAQLVNEKMGIDITQWMDAQGTFKLMADGFGIAEEQAYALSKGLTELAYDISSLKNIDPEEAVTKLRSALAGELEPIRALGLSISQATLQEYALSKGIDEAVTAMTEQEKALLRSVKVMEDATRIGYVGDFAKTLESPANAMRILQQQIEQLGRALGNVLLPIIVQIIPWVQAFVSVLTDAISALATFVGFTMPEWDNDSWSKGLTSGAEDAEDALGGAAKAAKELKNATLGIDELNVISPPEASGAGGAGGVSDWAKDLEISNIWDEQMISEIQTKSDQIKGIIRSVAQELETLFEPVTSRMSEFFQTMGQQFSEFDFGTALFDAFWATLDTLRAAIETVVDLTTPLVEALNIPQILYDGVNLYTSAVEALGDALDAVRTPAESFVENALVPVAEWLGDKISDALKFVSWQFKKIGDWFKRNEPTFQAFSDTLSGIYERLWKVVEPIADAAWLAFKEIVDLLVDTLLDFQETSIVVATSIGDAANAVYDFAESFGLVDVFVNNFTAAIEQVKLSVDGVLDVIDGFLVSIQGAFTGDWSTALDGLASVFDGYWTFIKESALLALNTINENVKAIFGVDLIDTVSTWFEEDVQPWFSAETWTELGENIKAGIKTKWDETVGQWATDVSTWWSEHVAPWFTLERWQELGSNIKNSLIAKWGETVTQWAADISKWWDEHVAPWFTIEKWKELGQQAIEGLFQGLSDIWENASEWGEDLLDDIKTVLGIHSPSKEFEDIGQYAVAGLENGFDNLQGVTALFSAELENMRLTASTFAADTLAMIQNALNMFLASLDTGETAVKGSTDSMTRMFRNMSNNSVSAINGIISRLNAIPRNITTVHTIITKSVSGSSGSTAKAYASGGFPDQGQLFLAREAGPELVGTIGGQTAVANNSQIIAGIKQGVVEAEQSQNALLREQNELLTQILAKTGTYLNGKQVTNLVEQTQRQRGASIMTGGVMAY